MEFLLISFGNEPNDTELKLCARRSEIQMG
jgi:hypothetical protein